jgi:hypothetical protein
MNAEIEAKLSLAAVKYAAVMRKSNEILALHAQVEKARRTIEDLRPEITREENEAKQLLLEVCHDVMKEMGT